MVIESMVIITRVYEPPYESEKDILDRREIGRIIYEGQSFNLENEFNIPRTIKEELKNEKTFILCIRGKYFRLTSPQEKEIIIEIFKELKIKCGICHPGGKHTLHEVSKENKFLNKIYLDTYSTENEARYISSLLKEILGSNEANRNEKLRALYYYIHKEKYLSESKKIIANWLPLAIDIQGLSEVFQKSIKKENGEDWKNKLKEYWKKIKKSGPFLSLWGNHNEIAGDYQELKLDKSEESKLKTFLEELDSTNRKKIPEEKYLDPESDFFFPNWLEKYTKRIQ